MSRLGTDFFCDDDVSEDLRVESDERSATIQALYRRLTVSSLWYDSAYGYGVFRLTLEGGVSTATIQAEIQRQLLQDERVQWVGVAALNTRIDITVRLHSDPSFPLTLSIDRVSGNLLPGVQVPAYAPGT
jgi:hypothetical protein